MTTVLIVIHVMVAIALICVVLLQRSEGGALGIGGGGGGFMTGRSAGNALTKTTARARRGVLRHEPRAYDHREPPVRPDLDLRSGRRRPGSGRWRIAARLDAAESSGAVRHAGTSGTIGPTVEVGSP